MEKMNLSCMNLALHFVECCFRTAFVSSCKTNSFFPFSFFLFLFSFFFFFFFFHTMVSRFCTENRLSFFFLVHVHHTHVRCNLVRKLARTVFKLASVEQSRFFMQQRLLFLSFVFCNWWGQRYIWRNVFLKYFVWDWWAGNKELL